VPCLSLNRFASGNARGATAFLTAAALQLQEKACMTLSLVFSTPAADRTKDRNAKLIPCARRSSRQTCKSHQCSTTTSGTTAKLAQMHSMKVSRSSKRGFQGAAFQNHEHRAPSQNKSLRRSQRSDVKIRIISGKSPIDASRGGAGS
jgi:hypothetical protein